eukprot:TRINITY_DN1860_c0_g1_i4.p1 TRINITY_DN1860_c0_g1~~TRINITY_DN1860_c0_g1_i4.p1  ORF type:complete len:571 (+),score=145.12 TRINITY_DN1860_c0_g1_i4:66-1778(+)
MCIRDRATLIHSLRNDAPPTFNGSRKPAINEYIPRVQPLWLKYDRKVLSFKAYFQESVVELRNENYRVRKCYIYYYLDDDTIYVTEPKIENSGIVQGVFIKRQKVPKDFEARQDHYTWRDFDIGINVELYGRVFRIVDCDKFTKHYYAERGIGLNPPEDVPEDPFDIQKQLKNLKINPPDTKEYKEYFEVKLGGGHPNTGLKQYLENDRKVLSFDIFWDDLSLEGGRNFFKLNYFLADNTVEVKEMNKVNSGKDPFPLLLKRGKLSKKPNMTHYPGMSQVKEEYYTPIDLRCGNTVTIYGRECVIFDCDEFTKNWYIKMGVDQVPIVLKTEKQKKFWQPIPPYNGYGTEEDSLGSVKGLQPKPPKKDFKKMFTSDQFILRFESRLVSENREENNRMFILSFFCGDDTIQVFTETERNSGIWGGKFLERNKWKNPITNEHYNQKDMKIGSTIIIGPYRFQLLRADDFTLNYMDQRPEIFPESQVEYVLDKVRSHAKNWSSVEQFVIDFVKHVDRNNNGFIEFDELCEGLKALKIHLTYHESYTLMKKFDLNGDFKLSMEEFYNSLVGGFQK